MKASEKSAFAVGVCIVLAFVLLTAGAAFGDDVYVGAGDVLTLKWTANPPAEKVDHYDVYYCDTIDGEYIFLVSVAVAQLKPVEMREGPTLFKLIAIDRARNPSGFSVPSPDRFIFDRTAPSEPGEISFTLVVAE